MVYISNLPGFVQQVYFVSFSQTGEIQPLHPVPYSSFSTDSVALWSSVSYCLFNPFRYWRRLSGSSRELRAVCSSLVARR